MWTFSCLRGVETVAVGFWAVGRYSGPTLCEGAEDWDSVDILVLILSEAGAEGLLEVSWD
jgi:hypothetical protein